MIILAVPAGAYFLFQWPSVQTYLTGQIAKQVSANLNARFEVGRVDIVFFNRVILRDIHIEDQHKDTLLKADRLIATIHHFNRSKREIGINQINMHNARINLRSGKDSVLNLQFIIDALTSDEPKKNKWDFTINAINLNDSEFSYKKHNFQSGKAGINFRDIDIGGMDLLINNLHTTEGHLHFNIRYLNFKEKSGFVLNHFASENSISDSAITVKNLHVVSPLSRLNLEHFNMTYDNFDAFKDFVNMVGLDGRFRSSVLNLQDLAYFAPKLRKTDQEVIISGNITGKINNLKGNDINLRVFDNTSLLADFNMVGLPDFKETFIFLDLYDFISSAEDIIKLSLQGNEDESMESKIPFDISALGDLNYTGKFTGFIDDFVAFGELNTDLGSLISDLSLRPGDDNSLNFNGQLRAVHFDAGTLTGSEQIGRISFNTGLDGQISPRTGVNANLEGTIDSLFIFDYNYKHIELSGLLADRKFEGLANIEDPNIFLDFLGSVDFSGEIPVFDFSANIDNAKLYELHFEDEDPSLTLSFVTRANFRGNNIDNLNGSIELVNAVFEKDGHLFDIKNATLEATGSGDQRKLILNSSLAEAEIEGSYEFATLISSFNQFISDYLPSLTGYRDFDSNVTGNSFSFSLIFQETAGFTEFFMPDMALSAGSGFNGIFDPSANISEINAHSGEFRLNNNLFKNINLSSHSRDSVFNLSSTIKHVTIGNRFNIENLTLYSDIMNDSLTFEAGWNNRQDIENVYKGEILALLSFDNANGTMPPPFNIDISPSDIVISDSLWNIGKSRIRIDSTSYFVDNFVFGQAGQYLKIDGKLSEDPHDSLFMEFQEMDMQNLKLLTTLNKFDMEGILGGRVSLSNIHESPLFSTDLEIKKLNLNHQDFGDLSIMSQWNNIGKNISIHAFSDRGDDRIINIEGNYQPEGKLLNFDISLAKINLRTFDGYIDEVFADLRGIAGGDLKLEGTINQPLFNGNIFLQKASFIVDYLKTRYNFTHDVTISNNNVTFKDLLVYDQRHNTCSANGTLSSNYFRDLSLNVYLYPDNFMALNTMERDNDMFYGQVYASGLVHISGPTDNITMDISAQTNRNTRFFIPLQKNSEIDDLHFLTFTGESADTIEDDHNQVIKEKNVNLSGMQMNFDLDVTPEAEVQIIFDSKIGDIIRGRGNGSIKMDINTLGQFNMLGEYIIEQGDYLFTLQNVINKRFDIERGSRISWTGDPFDANVDLQAVYKLRAPLNTLMAPYMNGTGDRYSRRMPVECHIVMKEKLMTPEISFDIELPTADPDTRRNVQGILNTEDKKNRQFLSLLIINNFLPEQDMTGTGRGASLGMSATEAGITTVSEFFSNQLSNWLSQLSRDVDFGVNWRPGDEITPDEVELALSTQVLNDRVSINGHVDVGGRQTNTSNIVGDFDVDIKLNRSGKLRLKAFTRANDNLIRPHLSPYTQGVGLFYREDFNSFDELLSRYWNIVFSENSSEKDQ